VQKKETETQTAFLQPPPLSRDSIVNRFRSSELCAILLRQSAQFTPTAPALVKSYNSRLGFYLAALYEPRFDPLTPPPDLFPDPPALVFEFFDATFSVGPPDAEPNFVFRYQPPMFPVLESLELGTIDRDFDALLNRLKCKCTDGLLICKAIDHRIVPGDEHRTALEIGADIVRRFVEQRPPSDPLESESQLLLWRRPVVCTDPSPDVARAQSVIDFRKKMWISRRDRTKEEDVCARRTVKRVERIVTGERIPQTRTRVDIPETIQQMCSRLASQQTVPT
jgi:hypothetical protein